MKDPHLLRIKKTGWWRTHTTWQPFLLQRKISKHNWTRTTSAKVVKQLLTAQFYTRLRVAANVKWFGGTHLEQRVGVIWQIERVLHFTGTQSQTKLLRPTSTCIAKSCRCCIDVHRLGVCCTSLAPRPSPNCCALHVNALQRRVSGVALTCTGRACAALHWHPDPAQTAVLYM